MTGLLIFIKHKLPFIWNFIECFNSILFKKLFRPGLRKELEQQLQNHRHEKYTFRQLTISDTDSLSLLLLKQPQQRIKYFQPHGFDRKSLTRLFSNHSLLLLGAFNENELVGYFFLRCFINKKCFVGRLVDESHSNKGIGKTMNQIMYNTGWNCGFRVMSTISKNNNLVIRSHMNNEHFTLLKDLPDDCELIEFRKSVNRTIFSAS